MIYWFFGLPGSGKDHCAQIMKNLTNATYFHVDDFLTKIDKTKLIKGSFTISDRVNKLKRVLKHISKLNLSLVNVVAADSLPDAKSRIFLQNYFGKNIMFIYVKVDPKIHENRIKKRKNHFFTYLLLENWTKKHWRPIRIAHTEVDNNIEGNASLTRQLKKLLKINNS